MLASLRRLVAIAAALFLAGCSSSSESGPVSYTLDPQDLLAYSHATALVPASVVANGTSAVLFVDTGSPFVAIDPAAFGDVVANGAVGNLALLQVGSSSFSDVQVVGASSLTPQDPHAPVVGVLGCSIICGHVASFDYQGARFGLDGALTPPAVGPGTSFAFTLEGGGTVQASNAPVTYPASRIVVDVMIEGAPHTMILDTGASYVTVRSTVFATLTADGRTTMPADAETASGADALTLARAKAVVVGGVEADGVVVAGGADTLFDTVTTEVGQTIDGSLGGTFLQGYFLTIDYPNQKVTLAPYADTSFVTDPGRRLGFDLASANDVYVVADVLPGTDAAAKGVSPGDTIVSIDGLELAAADLSEAAEALRGVPGQAKTIQFGEAEALANRTVTILVDELLPLPGM